MYDPRDKIKHRNNIKDYTMKRKQFLNATILSNVSIKMANINIYCHLIIRTFMKGISNFQDSRIFRTETLKNIFMV